jgi:hypothetical protein
VIKLSTRKYNSEEYKPKGYPLTIKYFVGRNRFANRSGQLCLVVGRLHNAEKRDDIFSFIKHPII